MCKVMHREAVVYNVAEQYVSPKNLNTGCDEATSTKSIFVIVLPVRPSLGGSKGCYEAHLQGRLVARSRTPFLDAARKLLAEGFSPNTVIAMRRAGSDTDGATAPSVIFPLWTLKTKPTNPHHLPDLLSTLSGQAQLVNHPSHILRSSFVHPSYLFGNDS